MDATEPTPTTEPAPEPKVRYARRGSRGPTTNITITVAADTLSRLDERAAALGISRSGVVEQALQAWLQPGRGEASPEVEP